MLRNTHLLFTASAHVFILNHASVAAALCLKCCLCLLEIMYPQEGARSAAPAFPVHASNGCGYTNTTHKVPGTLVYLSAIMSLLPVPCDFQLRSGRSLIWRHHECTDRQLLPEHIHLASVLGFPDCMPWV